MFYVMKEISIPFLTKHQTKDIRNDKIEWCHTCNIQWSMRYIVQHGHVGLCTNHHYEHELKSGVHKGKLHKLQEKERRSYYGKGISLSHGRQLALNSHKGTRRHHDEFFLAQDTRRAAWSEGTTENNKQLTRITALGTTVIIISRLSKTKIVFLLSMSRRLYPTTSDARPSALSFQTNSCASSTFLLQDYLKFW
jgi:hypothetical protein